MDKMLDLYFNFRDAVASLFGLDALYHHLNDLREPQWRIVDYEVTWWEDGNEYSATLYGTSVWRTEDYTLVYGDNGCGAIEAYLFANKNEVPA